MVVVAKGLFKISLYYSEKPCNPVINIENPRIAGDF